MNGKNIAAGLIISIVSIALAISITYFVSRNNSNRALIYQPPVAEVIPTTAVPASTATTVIDAGPRVDISPAINFNCTFPIETWLQYPEQWRIDRYSLGAKVYTKNEMIAILRRNDSEIRDLLLSQIFLVTLNQQHGADTSAIDAAFAQAVIWMETFPESSIPPDSDIMRAQELRSTLKNFTDGQLSIPPCRYDISQVAAPVLPTRAATATSTATATPVPTLKPRILPSWTPVPARRDEPTRKPAATKTPPPPTTEPPQIPTAKPSPIPRDTQPPTEPPPPPPSNP